MIANGQILSIFDCVILQRQDNGEYDRFMFAILTEIYFNT